MDRGAEKAPPLSGDELKFIFEVVAGGKTQETARQGLSERTRSTVNRAYNVAAEFERRGITSLDDSTATEIATAARYSASPSYVQRLFLQWRTSKAPGLPTGSKAILEDTLRREDGVHQEGLRKLITHIADWVRDWSKPLPLVSPAGPTVMPYGPDAKPLMGWRNIEQDPVYQALSEHLEGTETWKDFTRYKELRRLYWKATLPLEFSGDPEWVHSQEEKLAELRKTRDAIWKELDEVEYEVSRGFRKLLMLSRIPGKCRWCRRPHA